MIVLLDLARSARAASLMFWETLWPLVIGFLLSGAIQTFTTRAGMEARLGTRKMRAVIRAAGYGMASSSCSYAATSMARSLFAKGADFTVALVFMVASTNLVIELGVVLIVLIGWQFAIGEFIGGAVMIAILAFVGGAVLHVDRARIASGVSSSFMALDGERPVELPPRRSLRDIESWIDAGRYALGDAVMLWRELLVGYLVAGVLVALVPTSDWGRVFLHGHGMLTILENVAVAPLLAVVSCVCSIGNVPLAAALWKGGISFAGVLSFLFADLVALPLLFIYRRYYGSRLARRVFLVFWATMALAGLVTNAVFSFVHLVPTRQSARVLPTRFGFDLTTVLDIATLVFVAVTYLAYRVRRSHPATSRLARDPVCGMQVDKSTASSYQEDSGELVYFCSEHCRERYIEQRDVPVPHA